MPEGMSIQQKPNMWKRLIAPHEDVKEVGERSQAELAAALAMGSGIFHFIGAIGSLVGSGFYPTIVFGLIAVGFVCLVSYAICRSKKYRVGAGLLVSAIALSGFYFILTGTRDNAITLYGSITIALILSSALLGIRGFVALTAGMVLATFILPLIEPSFQILDSIIIGGSFLVFGILLAIARTLRDFIERNRLMETKATNVALVTLQNSLEQRVQERTHQIRTAAEVAHTISSALSLQEILDQTAHLIIDRFGYYHTGIYLLDDEGLNLNLRASAGKGAEELIQKSPRLRSDETSIVGWVSTHREIYTSPDTGHDPHYLKSEFQPETRSEVGIPILAGEHVLGVLDVQSQSLNAFDEDAVTTLRILAQQTAAAIQNLILLEAAQVDLQSINEIYRYGFQIANANNENEVYTTTNRALSATPFDGILLIPQISGSKVAVCTLGNVLGGWISAEQHLAIEGLLEDGPAIKNIDQLKGLSGSLFQFFLKVRITDLAIVPVRRQGALKAILIISSRTAQSILSAVIQPFSAMAELAVSALERIQVEDHLANQVTNLEAVTNTSQAISAATSLDSLFTVLHDHVRKNIGDTGFLVALFEPDTNSIYIPYMYENIGSGEKVTIESFPLGEGLTSIIIRTKQPLMIVEDTERRAAALGAKISGKPAKSWLGTPLIVANNVIGAIVIQDLEHENAFNENDLRFMTTMSSQVAGAINNINLIEETRKRALQLQTAAEIARDISGSLDISELLMKAVTLIHDRFQFYHAAIFLNDPIGEYTVIREATGEAGVQMKRAGHKLQIGSKSIVGYVTGSGDHLVVNDTARDATYYANPLLPETRSEVAVPLRVGQRTLGALDVQSDKTFAFSTEDINVLRVLADQLAIAVVNSELFAETQEHLSQHRLLHHVTTAAASGTTLSEALNSAAQGLQVTLGGDRVAILLADRTRKVLKVEAIAGYSEDVKDIEIAFGEGVTGWVAIHRQPLRLNDVSADERYIVVGTNVCSELAIPLTYREELLGVLNVESDQISAYSDNDEELLGTLGGSLAAIIANARLLEQIRGQADRERLLYEVTSKIRRSTDVQTILSTTASELSKALGARRAHIKIDANVQPEDKVNTKV
jgi:GAF domain-containing protein